MGGFNPIKILDPIIKPIVGIVKGIINIVGDVVGFVLNPMGAFDVPTPQNVQPDQEATGVTLTKNGTNVAIPIVYGFRRVGGVLIYAETAGTSNRDLYMTMVISEGEIAGISRILVDDIALPLPSNNLYAHGQAVSVTSGRYKGKISFACFNGKETAGAQGSVPSFFTSAPNWTKKERRMPGVAYAVFRITYPEIKTQEDQDANPFTGGIPKVQFDVLGKKVYNLANHTTGNLDLSADYENLPKIYSMNPANCLLDYMMNPRYGAGIPKELINADSFKTAKLKYEQTVTYNNTYSGEALTMNAVVETNNKVLDNLKVLIAGSRGIVPYTQGRYKLKVEDGGNATDIRSTVVTSAFDVTSDVVVDGITLDGERKKTKYNQVVVNYIDPDREFTNQQVIYNEAGIENLEDNDEELLKEFTFHTITNQAIAFEFARMIFKKSRSQKQISFKGTQELLNVEVGDIIRVTDPILQLNLDTFRVVAMTLQPDLTVDISAVEHDATLYPATGGAQVTIPAPIFIPDEINVNPRPRPTPTDPIGLVPPFGEPDSAGEIPVNNPLPPSLDDNFTVRQFAGPGELIVGDRNKQYTVRQTATGYQRTGNINIYMTNDNAQLLMRPDPAYYPGSESTIDIGGTSLILDTSISSNNYIVSANRLNYYYKIPFYDKIEFRMLTNSPNSSVDGIFVTYYDQKGNQVGRTGLGGALRGMDFLDIRCPTTDTYFVEIRYRKRLADDSEILYKDGSSLDVISQFGLNTLPYYDSVVGKNKQGTDVEAYVNYIIQNPNTAYLGITATPSLGLKSANSDTSRVDHDIGA